MSDVQTRDDRVAMQVFLPRDVVEKIDSLAGVETISRSAWIRRLVIGATRDLRSGAPA